MIFLTSRSSQDWHLLLSFSLGIRFSWFFVCWVVFYCILSGDDDDDDDFFVCLKTDMFTGSSVCVMDSGSTVSSVFKAFALLLWVYSSRASLSVSVGCWRWLRSSVLKAFAFLSVFCIHILGWTWDLGWCVYRITGSSSQRPLFPGLVCLFWIRGTGSIRVSRGKNMRKEVCQLQSWISVFLSIVGGYNSKKWGSDSYRTNPPTNSDCNLWTIYEKKKKVRGHCRANRNKKKLVWSGILKEGNGLGWASHCGGVLSEGRLLLAGLQSYWLEEPHSSELPQRLQSSGAQQEEEGEA